MKAANAIEERKQVTVMFVDVVGSMNMAAALNPERMREIMHELFNESAAVVQRYQGTVDSFTGDGLMVMFGAPIALEDHALRACIAALEIQSLARQLAISVRHRDDVDFHIRIGLNSGDVIAGDFGSAPRRYTATGHTVGMAKRMETAAEAGEILCSSSTARLIEHSTRLGPSLRVVIKGVDELVMVRRLEAVESDRLVMARDESPLMGRDADLARLLNAFDTGEASVVSVIGEPGLGKSRLIREFVSAATAVGAEIVIIRCEAHTEHVPLRVLSRMLRAFFDIRNLDVVSARSHIAAQLQGVIEPDSGDIDLLFDLLSIGDPAAAPPMTHVDARRHRLVDVMGKIVKNRLLRTVFVVEDLHWIDMASDDFLAEFAHALTATKSILVGTFRPEYVGRLRKMSDATITLSPLTESTTVALAAELLGEHPTAFGAAQRIARPSAGNPFFVEEIVRDLVGREVLRGNRGAYRLVGDVDSIAVPATVQAVLAARIDRLPFTAKSILNAAAVIGTSFGLDHLRVLLPDVEPEQLRSLVSAELIDQTQLVPAPRYTFRHPLVRTVCYESQLSVTRADSHRKLAKALETRNASALEENSALIAHHLEAAGELGAAYAWHMRSGNWLKYRDVVAARDSWERARAIADRLPFDHGELIDKRIEPRTQLTATAWLVASDSGRCYDELRRLANESGDMLSLARGMSGRLTSLIMTEGRVRDAAVMASELQTLLDAIDCPPALRAEILVAVAFAQYEGCAFEQALRTTNRLRRIGEANTADLAGGAAIAGVVKVLVGRRSEGQRDLSVALELADGHDPVTYAIVVSYKSDLVVLGFDLADERTVSETRDALRRAEAFGDPYALSLARLAHGTALLRTDHLDPEAGVELLQLSQADGIDIGGSLTDAEVSAVKARHGSCDDHIDRLRRTIDDEIKKGETLFVGFSVSVLVELLLKRGTHDDVNYVRDLVTRLENLVAPVALPALELWPLLCRSRLALADGDATRYTLLVTRYRELAEKLDANGHAAIANQLTAEPTFAGCPPPQAATS